MLQVEFPYSGGTYRLSGGREYPSFDATIVRLRTDAGLDGWGSDVAFAGIVHMGQTVPRRSLRCVLESRDMVSVTTADGDFPVVDGRVAAPDVPGLGVEPRMDVLGEPVASFEQ